MAFAKKSAIDTGESRLGTVPTTRAGLASLRKPPPLRIERAWLRRTSRCHNNNSSSRVSAFFLFFVDFYVGLEEPRGPRSTKVRTIDHQPSHFFTHVFKCFDYFFTAFNFFRFKNLIFFSFFVIFKFCKNILPTFYLLVFITEESLAIITHIIIIHPSIGLIHQISSSSSSSIIEPAHTSPQPSTTTEHQTHLPRGFSSAVPPREHGCLPNAKALASPAL